MVGYELLALVHHHLLVFWPQNEGLNMWRTQLENPTCGEKSFSAETLVFCRARQGESIPPLSVVIREDGHVW